MFFLVVNSGIIERRLISKPIHIPIHVYDEIVIIDPIIIVIVNEIFDNLIIKKKRIITFMVGVWTQ